MGNYRTRTVLSTGFEIETEMTIHAVYNNMQIENVVVDYRDRPEGSESKLNTFSDGFKVLHTIMKLYRDYKPFGFFGLCALILTLIAVVLFIPIFTLDPSMMIQGKVPGVSITNTGAGDPNNQASI